MDRRIPIANQTIASGNASLRVAWGVGNSLVAFSAPTNDRMNKESSTGGTKRGDLHSIAFEQSLYTPIFRKLVNESAQTFLSLQKLSVEEESISSSNLSRISRQYRSIIRDCQEQLDQECERINVMDPSKIEHNQLQSELLYKLELVWHLVEVLCIEKTSSGMVLHHLLQWIALNFTQCEDKARNVLGGTVTDADGMEHNGADYLDQPERHPDYWDAVSLYILQGRTEQARNLLHLHPEMDSDSFVSIDELLRKMPIYSGSATQSIADFEFRWRHWQTEVRARIDEGDFAADPMLSSIAGVLSGSETAYTGDGSPQELCETWYEWMVGKLLFTNPTVKYYDLSHYAQEAISKFGGLSSMTALDSVILACIEMDIPQVMNELCQILDNFWFSAHLMDLLHHADQLDQPNSSGNNAFGIGIDANTTDGIHTGDALREFLLLDYATCLMSHKSLWQVGVIYLDHCPVQGRHRLELLLERMPITTQKKAEKIIAVASERGMTSVVSSTCRVMGMKALKQDRIGTAMAWGLKSQDAKFTTFLSDQLLKRYCDVGAFSSEDLLDHLGSCMVVSERLTFLAKYREFHRLINNAEFSNAATLLHSLLWSRLAPKYFWVTLLIDALPFLDCGSEGLTEDMYSIEGENEESKDKVFFSSSQTYELMHCLQQLCLETELPLKQKLLLEEHETTIRMKLAKNLAKSLMSEGDLSAMNIHSN